MSAWKAGPEKPRTPFCWACSRRFHGRAFARIIEAGVEHDVHKNCVPSGAEVVGGSTTVPGEALR